MNIPIQVIDPDPRFTSRIENDFVVDLNTATSHQYVDLFSVEADIWGLADGTCVIRYRNWFLDPHGHSGRMIYVHAAPEAVREVLEASFARSSNRLHLALFREMLHSISR